MREMIAWLTKKYFQKRAFRVNRFKRNTLVDQEKILAKLLAKARNTTYGIRYNFSNISNLLDFQKQVPIVHYEDIAPFIEEMIIGKSNVLWPGTVPFFSKSSGTTNDVSKYIPVSRDSLYKNHYLAGKDMFSIYFSLYPNSNLFKNTGSMISLGGSFETNNQGIKIGDISAILMSEAPSWAQHYRQPSLPIALMKKWKEKIPAIIDETYKKNITHLSGVPTWFVSIFEEMQKTHPHKTLRDIWPNLELFIHGGVSFAPYRELFHKFIPFSDMNYLEVYNASEGFFAFQDDPKKQGEMLLLTHHGIFYEFINMTDYGRPSAKAIPLSEVKVGIHYAMIITTNAGLWRYDIGDTVCFTSIQPYRIKISGRTKHHINIVGEELMVGNTDHAVSVLSEKYNILIYDYTVGPIFMDSSGKAGHEWIIEAEKPVDMTVFQNELDKILCEINSDYQAKRQDNIVLQKPILHFVKKGTFMKWMEQRGKVGGQHKVPRLSNMRHYIDQILAI